MSPLEAPDNREKLDNREIIVRYCIISNKFSVKPGYAQPERKAFDIVGNAVKCFFFQKVTLPFGKENCLKLICFATYKLKNINGEIIEGKYYEHEFFKSQFKIESDNKVLEALSILVAINDEKQIRPHKATANNN